MNHKYRASIALLLAVSCYTFAEPLEDIFDSKDSLVATKWSAYTEYYQYYNARRLVIYDSTYREFIDKEGEKYDFKNWSGKQGIEKGIIVLSKQFFIQTKLSISRIHSDAIFYNNITLFQKTRAIIHSGHSINYRPEIELRIFDDCVKAQEYLVSTTLTSSGRKWTIVDKNLSVGDIALSLGKEKRFSLHFVRNNVLVLLRWGIEDEIFMLATIIDSIVKNVDALDMNGRFNLPALVITPEVTSEFQWKPGDCKK
ncbi:MAG: hypothetical protein WBB67_01210 [bacterium]